MQLVEQAEARGSMYVREVNHPACGGVAVTVASADSYY